jgi:hypothetical protein
VLVVLVVLLVRSELEVSALVALLVPADQSEVVEPPALPVPAAQVDKGAAPLLHRAYQRPGVM